MREKKQDRMVKYHHNLKPVMVERKAAVLRFLMVALVARGRMAFHLNNLILE